MSVVASLLADHDVGSQHIVSSKPVDCFKKLANSFIVALRLKLLYLFNCIMNEDLTFHICFLFVFSSAARFHLDILFDTDLMLILVLRLALATSRTLQTSRYQYRLSHRYLEFTSMMIPTTRIEGNRRKRCAGSFGG